MEKKYLYIAIHTHKYGEDTYTLKSNEFYHDNSDTLIERAINAAGIDFEESAGENISVNLINPEFIKDLDA